MCSSATEESGDNCALCDPRPKTRKKRSRAGEGRRRSKSLSTKQYDSGRVLGTRRVAINSSSSTGVGVCQATFLQRTLSATCRKGHNILPGERCLSRMICLSGGVAALLGYCRIYQIKRTRTDKFVSPFSSAKSSWVILVGARFHKKNMVVCLSCPSLFITIVTT